MWLLSFKKVLEGVSWLMGPMRKLGHRREKSWTTMVFIVKFSLVSNILACSGHFIICLLSS